MKTAMLLLASLLVPALASAQVPEYLPYQGYLETAGGDSVDGLVDLTFKIYEGGDDQVALWEETHRGVVVEAGVFYVQLANDQPVVDEVVEGRTRYLGISVNQDAEAQPRQRIGSVPYALLAADSLALGGLPADEFAPRVEVQNMIDQIIAGGGGLTIEQVNELIDARGYLSTDAINVLIDNRGYLSEEAIIALIDARIIEGGDGLDADAVNALIDARNYLDEDAVNALIDARNYLDEAAITNLIDARITANNVDIDAQFANLQAQIDVLQQNVENLQNGAAAYILGLSAQTSNGRFTFNNVNGLQAAHAMCQESFADDANAHMCSPSEVANALGTGSFNRNNQFNNVNTWTMGPAMVGATFQGTLPNTCQNFMYNSGDIGRGTRLTVRLNYQSPGNGGGVTGNVYDVRQEIPCNTNMPVLCCR